MKATILVSLLVPMFTQGLVALSPTSDQFSTSTLNTSRWIVFRYGSAAIFPSSGRVQYTVLKNAGEDDYAGLVLRNNSPGYNESWQVILDVANAAGQGDYVGVCLHIANSADQSDNVNLEFYGKGVGGGFNFYSVTNDVDNDTYDIKANPNVAKGSMRVSFSGNTKLFTMWYDSTGSADGYQWNRLCTFSPTGQGGDRRGNWRMGNTNGRFIVNLMTYSENRTVAKGMVSFDNFVLKAGK